MFLLSAGTYPARWAFLDCGKTPSPSPDGLSPSSLQSWRCWMRSETSPGRLMGEVRYLSPPYTSSCTCVEAQVCGVSPPRGWTGSCADGEEMRTSGDLFTTPGQRLGPLLREGSIVILDTPGNRRVTSLPLPPFPQQHMGTCRSREAAPP